MLPIVLLCGKAGAGKDMVGQHLVRTFGATQIALADPIKRMAAELFGFTEDQLWGESSRRSELVPTRLFDWLSIKRGLTEGACRYLFRGDEAYQWLDNFKTQASIDDGLTPRYVLQMLGTDIARARDRDIWIKEAVQTALALLGGEYTYDRTSGLSRAPSTPPAPLVVITDGRFANEIVNIRAIGGTAFQILREVQQAKSGLSSHASETAMDAIPAHFYNATLNNNSDCQDICDKAGWQVAFDVMA